MYLTLRRIRSRRSESERNLLVWQGEECCWMASRTMGQRSRRLAVEDAAVGF